MAEFIKIVKYYWLKQFVLKYDLNGNVILPLKYQGKVCQYCNCETELVLGEQIWPHNTSLNPRPSYLDKKFYRCKQNKDHYVGTYHDNVKSLGSTADANLRRLRNQGHQMFDPLWRDPSIKVFKNRMDAYKWLSEKMGLPIELTHFGMFDPVQCLHAHKLISERLKEYD
jgi:hypothetical protein